MAKTQQKFPNPKNLVRVSKLKKMIDSLESDNYTMNRMMDNDRPEDVDTHFRPKIQHNQDKINKYKKILKSGKRYKVGL